MINRFLLAVAMLAGLMVLFSNVTCSDEQLQTPGNTSVNPQMETPAQTPLKLYPRIVLDSLYCEKESKWDCMLRELG